MSRSIVLRMAAVALFASAAAWSLHQQAGYIVASWSCAHAPEGVWVSGAIALVLLLSGSWISWRAFVRTGAEDRPRHFLAAVALMGAAVFGFALLLQIAAPFFLPGCI